MTDKKFLNFFLFYSPPNREICERLINKAHDQGLRISHIVEVSVMRDEGSVEILKQYRDEYHDEIVPWMSPDTAMLKALDICEPSSFFCYFSASAKMKLASAIAGMYRATFAAGMESVASFNMDAATLRALKKAAPELVCAMAACFEEGINVLHGHRYFDREWVCLTEGGPWWPWIPRRKNSLAPAGPGDEKIDLVCIPHLTRDLMQSYDRRDDFNSSQPMDEMRGKSVRSEHIGFTKRLFAESMRQAAFNGYGYYQFLESHGPFSPDNPHVFDEDSADIVPVYEAYIDFLGDKVKSGAIQSVSMKEFGDWYRKEFDGVTAPTLACWRDLLHGSGKEYVWYLDQNMRVLFAPNRGGAILDLRPYAAQMDKEIGIDTESLWDMSYPFIIQNHHRYTSLCKGMIKYEGELIDLSERFFTVQELRRDDSAVTIVFEPKELRFKSMRCVISMQTEITRNGEIRFRRSISAPESVGGKLEFCETLRGTWGTIDLPTNLAGLTLTASGGDRTHRLVYAHKGRMIRLENSTHCQVGFPADGFIMTLATDEPDCTAVVREGTLFQSFYEMSLEKTFDFMGAASFETWLFFTRGIVPVAEDNVGNILRGWEAPPPFKTAWGPSAHPLRCPKCLHAEREVHLLEEDGLFRCPFCSFFGTREEINTLYEQLRPRGCRWRGV